MNKILPDPLGLAEQAQMEGDAGLVLPGQGIGRRYMDAVVVLREKKWSFPAITKWMEEHGVVLSDAGWRSAYDVHTGKKSYAKKK